MCNSPAKKVYRQSTTTSQLLCLHGVLHSGLGSAKGYWRTGVSVSSETTQLLRDSRGVPDILIIDPTAPPVAIECEILPAREVEKDARKRLGASLRNSNQVIELVVGVRYPESLANYAGRELRAKIRQDQKSLSMALFSGPSESNYSRWPETGWMEGDFRDLSILVQHSTIRSSSIEKAKKIISQAVCDASAIILPFFLPKSQAVSRLSEVLSLCPSDEKARTVQTIRMASLIVFNAVMIHESLAAQKRDFPDLKAPSQLKRSAERNKRMVSMNDHFSQNGRKYLKKIMFPYLDLPKKYCI